MKLLHLYPKDDPVIAKHVQLLQEYGRDMACGDDERPDIVHVHGCWNYAIVRRAEQLRRKGARIVLTPHGGLDPWVIAERRLTEKTAKALLWQRRLIEHSYVLIAQGRMEAEAASHLGWNPRTETIRNAVITSSITPKAMYCQTTAVYQKVMDSYTFELMNDDTLLLMTKLIKAGITGDRRWLPEDDFEPHGFMRSKLSDISADDWRHLLLYTEHENIRAVVDRGISILGISQPAVDTSASVSYLPTQYVRPEVTATDVVGITTEINRGALTMRHIVELAQALRNPDADDDKIVAALTDSHLARLFQRLMHLLEEFTLHEEGFMPLPPVNDKQTQAIRKRLVERLRI